jgi:integrase
MANDLALSPMNGLTERQHLNIAALTSGYSLNTQAAMKSVWTLYRTWCEHERLDPQQLDAVQVSAFLMAHPARHSTQQSRVAHLRNIIGLMADATDQPALKQVYATLKRFKLSNDEGAAYYAEVRTRHPSQALSGQEVWQALAQKWPKKLETLRNRAILALLFYSGLRRSELVKLRWEDVNWQDRTLSIVGSKKRAADEVDYAPLMPNALPYLEAWLAACGNERVYVFCSINKGGHLGKDKPLAGETVRVICGPDFRPHDARHTLGTQALENLTPINQVQAALRHKSPTMTLRYAKHVETKMLADKLKLGY